MANTASVIITVTRFRIYRVEVSEVKLEFDYGSSSHKLLLKLKFINKKNDSFICVGENMMRIQLFDQTQSGIFSNWNCCFRQQIYVDMFWHKWPWWPFWSDVINYASEQHKSADKSNSLSCWKFQVNNYCVKGIFRDHSRDNALNFHKR